MVEEYRQGSSLNLQRARRDGLEQANVSRGIQTQSLCDPSLGLLRVETHTERKAALLRLRERRLGAVLCRVWDEWQDIETGEPRKSCTIIVTAANNFTRNIHDRMPVVLDAENFRSWLAGVGGSELLKPAPDILQMWPVSRRVNSVGNDDDPKLIEAIQ